MTIITNIDHYTNTFGIMDIGHVPKTVEDKWLCTWNNTTNTNDTAKNFIMLLPPPNITGSLHIGHAFTASIEDMIIRYKKMCGYNVLWIPGMDHAGIATQTVVEKKLYKDFKKTKHDIGREEFMKLIHAWKEEKGNIILKQLELIGANLNVDMTFFTLDKIRSEAVTEAFIRLYNKGLIYRDTKFVNWCYALGTVISDIEVDSLLVFKKTKRSVPGHKRESYDFGLIYEIKYKIINNDDSNEEYISVMTTRPETMLGDIAIIVNPNDERYFQYIGKSISHPYHPSRSLKIITDSFADMTLGTGAVKITPSHDEKDYECAKRLGIDIKNADKDSIFDAKGCISKEAAGIFTELIGVQRYDARIMIIKDLEKRNLYNGCKDHEHTLPICSRSGDIIEPILMPQWYVNVDNMANRATTAVSDGSLKLIPNFHEKTWNTWLTKIRPWCISRQLWWGHRIPVWKTKDNQYIVAHNEEEAHKICLEKYGHCDILQDPDVLDTWFSSALLPFSSLEWPNNTEKINKFFPNSILETGHDILFFWVARMVMLSLELTDKLPFNTVYLHAMIRDSQGRKMSKSLGNVIDPVHVIEGCSLEDLILSMKNGNGGISEKEIKIAEAGIRREYPNGFSKCGSDALRFSLISYTVQEMDICLNIKTVESNKRFCNKIWNIVKFYKEYSENENMSNDIKLEDSASKWIYYRLNECIKLCNDAMNNYKFFKVTDSLYIFWYELADIYIECIKYFSKPVNMMLVMKHCLHIALRLTHIVMPCITEELWSILNFEKRVSDTSYPEYENGIESCETFENVMLCIKNKTYNIDKLTEDEKKYLVALKKI